MQSLRDSVETSVSIGLFKTREDSATSHIFKSKLGTLTIAECRKLENFNPDRLQDSAAKAYPLDDRPRGKDDLKSVKYHLRQLENGTADPIWVYSSGGKMTLLDGAHRIVAHYIAGKRSVPCHIVKKE